jgi:hypothetical protein
MTLAVARWKRDDELFWRYALVAHKGRRRTRDGPPPVRRPSGQKEERMGHVDTDQRAEQKL